MALLRGRNVQRLRVILTQVVPIDLLSRLELDLALAEGARDLGERRPFCRVLAPALCDKLPRRLALLREQQ
jgi:hypothetical protein